MEAEQSGDGHHVGQRHCLLPGSPRPYFRSRRAERSRGLGLGPAEDVDCLLEEGDGSSAGCCRTGGRRSIAAQDSSLDLGRGDAEEAGELQDVLERRLGYSAMVASDDRQEADPRQGENGRVTGLTPRETEVLAAGRSVSCRSRS